MPMVIASQEASLELKYIPPPIIPGLSLLIDSKKDTPISVTSLPFDFLPPMEKFETMFQCLSRVSFPNPPDNWHEKFR